MEFAVRLEEECIDVLGEALSTLQKAPVKWYAPHNHMAFSNVTLGKTKSLRGGKLLALTQGEWAYGKAHCHTIVQATMILQNLADDPGRGTAADNQQYVFAG